MVSGSNIFQDKAHKKILFSFRGRVPVIFHWILKVYETVLLFKKYLTSKIEKNVPYEFFLQFYEPPDLGKKIFTT